MTGTVMSQILPDGDNLEIGNATEVEGQLERAGQPETASAAQRRVSNRIYNRLLLNILYVINQKYGLNL